MDTLPILGISILLPSMLIFVGICLYSGINLLIIWLRQKTNRSYLFFGISSFIVAVYVLLNYFLYQVDTIEQAIIIMQMRDIVLPLFYISFGWFLYSFRNIKTNNLLYIFTFLWSFLFIISFFLPSGHFNESISRIYKITLPWGETLIGIDGNFDFILGSLDLILSLATFVFTFYCGVVFYKQKNKTKGMALMIVGLSWLISLINDLLVEMHLIQSIYIGEFVFIIIVLLVPFALSYEWYTLNVKSKETEEKFAKAFFNNPDPLYITSIPEGIFIDINPMFEKVSGYKRNELIGKNVNDIGFYLNKEYRTNLFEELKNKGKLDGYEIPFKVRNGDVRDCLVFSEIIKIQNKPCLISIVRDITEQKQAELALKESEERFQSLYFSARSGLFRTSLSDGKILECNNLVADIFGYDSREEFLSEFIALEHYANPDDREKMKEILTAKGEVNNYEILATKKDGSKFWVRYSAKLYPEDGYLEGGIIDINEMKITENNLKESEEKYRILFEQNLTGIFRSTLEGKILDCNDAFVKIYGYSSKEEVLNLDAVAMYTGNEADRSNFMAKLKKNKVFKNLESQGKKKDGSHLWILENIQLLSNNIIQGSLIDITEHKQMEIELIDKQMRLNAVFDHNYQLTGLLDTKGRVLAANKKVQEFSGLEESDIIGKLAWDMPLWAKTQRQEVQSALERALKGEFVRYETYHVNTKGEIRNVDFSLNPVFDSENNVIYLVPEARDITAIKQQEKEIVDYQTKLKKLSSQITITEEKERRRIALNLHDHLTQLLAMSKIKLSEIKKDDLPKSKLEYLEEVKNYINEAIKNSREITFDLSPTILYDLGLPESIKWLLKQVEEKNNIKTSFNNTTENIDLDNDMKIMLYRAVSELLNNCIKHSSCKNLSVKLWNENKILFIGVNDDGKGFETITLKNRDLKEGGFGLFSIKERMEYAKGKMKIDSFLGKGTKITLSLRLKN